MKPHFIIMCALIGQCSGAVLWSASDDTGQYWNGHSLGGIGAETVDWGTMNQRSMVESFTFGYGTDSTIDVGMTINFYSTHTAGAVDPLIASFDFVLPSAGGTPGDFEGDFITYNLDPSEYFELSGGFEYGFQYTDIGDGTGLAPLLVSENVVLAPGTVDLFTTQNASFFEQFSSGGQSGGGVPGVYWFGDPGAGGTYAQFYMHMEGTVVPEPSISILALSGLSGLLLRRNRRA